MLAQPAPAEDQPFAAAMSHYTRGLALAATGKAQAADDEMSSLRRIMDAPASKSLDNPQLIVYRIRPTRVRYMQEWALEYHDVPQL